VDVVRWRVSLGREMIDYQSAGLVLTIQLRCRVCGAEEEAVSGHPLYPREVRDGRSAHTYGEEPSWFRFAVTARLANNRNCQECGYASGIPRRQQDALIAQADAAVQVDWLREGVKTAGFTVERVPETGEYFAYDRYLPGRKAVELPWQNCFEAEPT
jgi:hypothetical protein